MRALKYLISCAVLTFPSYLVEAIEGLDAKLDSQAQPVPFIQAVARSPNSRHNAVYNLIYRRQQGDCQANHISCASLSAPEACCPNNTVCARDSQGNIACCPVNNVCTGNPGSASTSGNSQTSQTGGAGAGPITVTITSTAGVTSAPTPTTMTTGAQQSFSLIQGTVPNDYYPYPVIATSYPNAAVCSQAITFCQIQSTSCYQSLAGNNGITISNGMGGGGVTQTGSGAASVNPSVAITANALCASLSSRACFNLRDTECSSLGASGGTLVVQPGGAAAPRKTEAARLGGYAAAGLVGAMGLFL